MAQLPFSHLFLTVCVCVRACVGATIIARVNYENALKLNCAEEFYKLPDVCGDKVLVFYVCLVNPVATGGGARGQLAYCKLCIFLSREGTVCLTPLS